jgi:hypothetical protein
VRSVLILCLSVFFLAGCTAPRLTAHVQSFAEPAALAGNPAVYITSGSGLTDKSLEFQRYSELLAKQLSAAKMRTVAQIENADLIAELDYHIDEGSTVSTTTERPQHFHPFGYYGIGSSGSRRGLGATFTFPITNERTISSKQIYTRSVNLTLLQRESRDAKEPVRVFEGKIISRGTCPLLAQIMPEMLQGLFLDFPHTSGEIEIETDKGCSTSTAK